MYTEQTGRSDYVVMFPAGEHIDFSEGIEVDCSTDKGRYVIYYD